MAAYLAYSYSANLSKEQAIIEQDLNKSRKEFGAGFKKGLHISFSVYSLYMLTTAASAHAVDTDPN
jgi:hypothetical protein